MRLTRKGFVAWLRSKGSSDMVGMSVTYSSCPLATYLEFVTGEQCGVVSDIWERHLHSGTGPISSKNPAWASAFIKALDTGPSHDVTARHALKLLGENNGN